MKFYISYFYQIRFFEKHMIPISTCYSDPNWYYNYRQPGTIYKDKHGVLNGLREDSLMIDEDRVNQVEAADNMCKKDCPFKEHLPCMFMRKYREYLDTLDFDELVNKLTRAAEISAEILKLDCEPVIVLMVYEPISCKCAERPVLQAYFKAHGIDLLEWQPPHKVEKHIDLF